MSWNLNVLGDVSSGSLWWSGCLQTEKNLLCCSCSIVGLVWSGFAQAPVTEERIGVLHHLHFLSDFRSDSWQLMNCEVHREENIYVIIFVGKWIKAVGSCPKEIWDLNQILWVVKWGGNQAPISLFTICATSRPHLTLPGQKTHSCLPDGIRTDAASLLITLCVHLVKGSKIWNFVKTPLRTQKCL